MISVACLYGQWRVIGAAHGIRRWVDVTIREDDGPQYEEGSCQFLGDGIGRRRDVPDKADCWGLWL